MGWRERRRAAEELIMATDLYRDLDRAGRVTRQDAKRIGRAQERYDRETNLLTKLV